LIVVLFLDFPYKVYPLCTGCFPSIKFSSDKKKVWRERRRGMTNPSNWLGWKRERINPFSSTISNPSRVRQLGGQRGKGFFFY
jgi:hypothetical protein